MELFVVLPATACSGSSTSRTVALEVGPAASTTVRELKEAIQRRSAQVYGLSSSRSSSRSSTSSSRGEENVAEEEEEEGLGGIPAGLQRLTLGGRHLRDEQMLAECAIVGYVIKGVDNCNVPPIM
jgi:hypothetical protein